MHGFILDDERDTITQVANRVVITERHAYDEWEFVGRAERGEVKLDADTLLMLHRRGHFTVSEMVKMLAKHFNFGDTFSDGVDVCPNCGVDATLLNECKACAFRCEYGNPER